MTVYVVNKNKDDISDAKRYGDIVYVNDHYITADRVDDERLPPAFAQNMKRAADEFRPDEDFLLIFGDHLQLIAFSSMLAIRYDFYRVLRWDRQEQAYYPVQIQV